MGKSKARILRKGINNLFTKMTREEAVIKATNFLNEGDKIAALDLITMFGLYAEDVLEAGADYEKVIAIKNSFQK